MDRLLEDLIKVMTLERLELNLFRGESRDIGSPQVFGGQVLGQALVAASATVEGRDAHSLHAYFLRRGDFNSPIVYEVDRARDGNHFSTRRVVAVQHGEQIFNMSASFQEPESGLEHQLAMPRVPPADDLPDLQSLLEEVLPRLPSEMRRLLQQKRPFEFRPVETPPFLQPPASRESPTSASQPSSSAQPGASPRAPSSPHRNLWFRAVDKLPDDDALHRCLLAYVSDFYLLDTAMIAHGISQLQSKLTVASIDHAMWFHRRARVDDWLLYSTDSPSASGVRAFARGSVFAQDGRLVASTCQEGLLRVTPRSREPAA
jgi:acyl-CoA thioesterase-2